MIVVNHDVKGNSDLLRGELLTIIAAIRTRLALPEMKDDLVVPVLLFSAMSRQSRILHAYYKDETLIIKKVALLDFVVEDNNSAYARLLRAIANTPTGDTKSLP